MTMAEHDLVREHEDPIVAEVRAQREELVEAVGGDARRLFADLKALEQREREAGRVILSAPDPGESGGAA